jgi:hypothetical protein
MTMMLKPDYCGAGAAVTGGGAAAGAGAGAAAAIGITPFERLSSNFPPPCWLQATTSADMIVQAAARCCFVATEIQFMFTVVPFTV